MLDIRFMSWMSSLREEESMTEVILVGTGHFFQHGPNVQHCGTGHFFQHGH